MCTLGKVALGGGANSLADNSSLKVTAPVTIVGPAGQPRAEGWRAVSTAPNGGIAVWVICANVS